MTSKICTSVNDCHYVHKKINPNCGISGCPLCTKYGGRNGDYHIELFHPDVWNEFASNNADGCHENGDTKKPDLVQHSNDTVSANPQPSQSEPKNLNDPSVNILSKSAKASIKKPGQSNPNSRQSTPVFRQPTPISRQPTPISRQPTPGFRQNNSDKNGGAKYEKYRALVKDKFPAISAEIDTCQNPAAFVSNWLKESANRELCKQLLPHIPSDKFKGFMGCVHRVPFDNPMEIDGEDWGGVVCMRPAIDSNGKNISRQFCVVHIWCHPKVALDLFEQTQ
jgi:hypothetical protein